MYARVNAFFYSRLDAIAFSPSSTQDGHHSALSPRSDPPDSLHSVATADTRLDLAGVASVTNL